jgi:hypothetical protein
VPWEWLVHLSNSIRDSGLEIFCRGKNQTGLTRISGFSLNTIESVRNVDSPRKVPTSFIIFSSRVRDVEKPIDRVYGFLGIAEEGLREAITVDYSEESQRDYWRLYLQLGRYTVTRDIHHHILGQSIGQQIYRHGVQI